jgi:hypothetical protein
MLVGELPFSGATPEDLFQQVLNSEETLNFPTGNQHEIVWLLLLLLLLFVVVLVSVSCFLFLVSCLVIGVVVC